MYCLIDDGCVGQLEAVEDGRVHFQGHPVLPQGRVVARVVPKCQADVLKLCDICFCYKETLLNMRYYKLQKMQNVLNFM